jgi:hypothetical protein
MLSERNLNTHYRGSMSHIIGKEDTTIYDGVDVETIVMDMKPEGQYKGVQGQIPANAVSQYVKGVNYNRNVRNENYGERLEYPERNGLRNDYEEEEEEGVEYYA